MRLNKRNYSSLSPMAQRMIDVIYTLIDENEAPITTAALLQRLGNVSETNCRASLKVLAKRRIIELDVEGRDDPLIVAVSHQQFSRLDVRTMHGA